MLAFHENKKNLFKIAGMFPKTYKKVQDVEKNMILYCATVYFIIYILIQTYLILLINA